MKLYELAKMVEKDWKEIQTLLNEHELPVKSHLTPVTDEQVQLVLKTYKATKATAKDIDDKMNEAVSSKRFNETDMIPCRSVRGNRVIFSSDRTGFTYDWVEFGSVVPVAYIDLLNMYGRQSEYLFAPYIMIEDEDLYLQWSNRLEKIYTEWLDIDNPSNIFQQNDALFESFVSGASKSIKELLGTTAVKMIKNGGQLTIRKVQILDDLCGTALRELYW